MIKNIVINLVNLIVLLLFVISCNLNTNKTQIICKNYSNIDSLIIHELSFTNIDTRKYIREIIDNEDLENTQILFKRNNNSLRIVKYWDNSDFKIFWNNQSISIDKAYLPNFFNHILNLEKAKVVDFQLNSKDYLLLTTDLYGASGKAINIYNYLLIDLTSQKLLCFKGFHLSENFLTKSEKDLYLQSLMLETPKNTDSTEYYSISCYKIHNNSIDTIYKNCHIEYDNKKLDWKICK